MVQFLVEMLQTFDLEAVRSETFGQYYRVIATNLVTMPVCWKEMTTCGRLRSVGVHFPQARYLRSPNGLAESVGTKWRNALQGYFAKIFKGSGIWKILVQGVPQEQGVYATLGLHSKYCSWNKNAQTELHRYSRIQPAAH